MRLRHGQLRPDDAELVFPGLEADQGYRHVPKTVPLPANLVGNIGNPAADLGVRA